MNNNSFVRYYQKDKEKPQKKAHKRYLSKEEK